MKASKYNEPFIPGRLTSFYDEQAALAHERMAGESLNSLLFATPRARAVEVGGKRLLYIDMPSYEAVSDEAVVLSLPFANGWKPHMFLRARYLQEAVAPDKRLIVLPHTSFRETAYELNEADLKKIEKGDISPIAEQQARLIRALGIGRVSILGYSFGGMNAAVMAKVMADDIELLTVGVFEPTNVKSRTPAELSKDFKKTGWGPFRKAVEDAQIPALSETMNTRRVILDLAKFGLTTSFLNDQNHAIKQAMGINSLAYDLASVERNQPGTPITLVAAEKSTIAPPADLFTHHTILLDRLANVETKVIDHYGHEMGDNIVVHGLLGKAALSRAKK